MSAALDCPQILIVKVLADSCSPAWTWKLEKGYDVGAALWEREKPRCADVDVKYGCLGTLHLHAEKTH